MRGDRRRSWAASSPSPWAGADKAQTTWSYTIEPDGGGCVVTESYVENKPMGAAMKFLTRVTTGVKDREADLAEGMRTTLAGLKDVAEKG